jgi:hypothetical protein
MRKRHLITIMALCLIFYGLPLAWGDPVTQELYFTMKTTLTADATYNFRFSLWDDDTVGSGTMVWSEEKSVKLKGVKIITYLGDTTPLDGIDFSQQYWVQVERKKKTGFAVVGIRTMLGIAPYAMWAISPAGPQGETGPIGATGATGDTGLTGATGATGAGVAFEGPWDSGETYHLNFAFIGRQ